MSKEFTVNAHCLAHAGPDDVYPPPSNTPAHRRRPNEGKYYVFNSVSFISSTKLIVSAIYVQCRRR